MSYFEVGNSRNIEDENFCGYDFGDLGRRSFLSSFLSKTSMLLEMLVVYFKEVQV